MLKSKINSGLSGTLVKLIFTFLIFTFLSTNLYAQVTQEWVARYDISGSYWWGDIASSLAVDSSGNVYVTGWSWWEGFDYATIKYNSNGDSLWVQRYHGEAYSLAVDNSGNVYVTGISGSAISWDYATIKYNSSGDTLWVRRYNPNPMTSLINYARSLAVDNSGNVYVTGHSQLLYGPEYYYDYATLKYNTNGVQQWVARYTGPGVGNDYAYSIAVDSSGNAYVTGYSQGDYATIKYNTSGGQLWLSRYNGPANGVDAASSIAVDGSGNVYVTGNSAGSGTGQDYATVKYNTSGVQQWTSRYNGPGNANDGATSIVVDDLGNVYVTGNSPGNGTGTDIATIKYNSNGDTLWVRRYNGPGNGSDGTNSIAMDGFGNVYVTGYSSGSGTGTDYVTIKYNIHGVQQWVQRYNGPANGRDSASSIAIDGLGNVYVTGSSVGIGTGNDYVTIKYSQPPPPIPVAPLLISPVNNAVGQGLNLSLVWNSVEFASIYRIQLATDTSFTNIILDDSTLTDTIITVTNLSPLTNYYWRVNARNVSGTGPFSSVWRFKTKGAPTQVNLLYPPNNSNNISVNLNFIWSKPGEQTYSNRTLKPNNKDSRVISKYWFELTTDTSGIPLIIDSTLTDTTKFVSNLNGFTSYYWHVKAKNEIGWGIFSHWFKFTTVLLAPVAPELVYPENYAMLVELNPLLDWDSSETAENYRIQLSEDLLFTNTVYDSSNIPITEFQIPNNGLNINTTYYWRVNATNVTGTSPWSSVFHFTTGTTNITLNNEIPKEFRLYNSYPNPFNPSTKIKFDIPKSSYVKLIVYDVLGREIKTLVNEKLNAGRYEVSWPAPTGDGSSYPSGVYFYRLVTDEYVSVRKMILIK